MRKIIPMLLIFIILAGGLQMNNIFADTPQTAHQQTLTLDPTTTFQTMEGFGFFGARAVWWDRVPFNPTRERALYAGGEPMTDMEWIDFILLDLGITMWRNEIYPFLPVYSLDSTNPQDSNWLEQKHFVKALNDRAVELGIDLRVILTVWSPPGEWKNNQHTRALAASQSPPPPPDGVGMQEWNRLMPEHYVDFAHWLVSALEMYRQIGVDVYAISPQNEPYFNQNFNSSFYNAAEFVEMLNIVAPIIYDHFPNVYIFGAEAMLGHEHSSVVADWTNPNMQFHRRILERATPEAMRNFVFAHHGYYDGVYAQALEGHAALWAAERDMLRTRGSNSSPYHRLWMTETSGYSNEWLDDNPDRPGSLALAMAIQSALIYGDVSAWVWWQGSDLTPSPTGGYYELMRPGLNQNKIAASQHFYRYIRPGAVRIGAELSQESRNLMASAFVHDQLGNTVIIFVNNGADYYNVNIQGMATGTVFQSVVSTGSPHYLVPGSDITVGGDAAILIPPHSVITLVNGSYTEHGSRTYPVFTQAEMAQRDVNLAKNALETVNAGQATFVTNSRLAYDKESAVNIAGRFVDRWAFYLDWEVVPIGFTPAVNARPDTDSIGVNGELTFQVLVAQNEFNTTTEVLSLQVEYVMDYTPLPVQEAADDLLDEILPEVPVPEEPEIHEPTTAYEETRNRSNTRKIATLASIAIVLAAVAIFLIKRKS